MILVAIEIGLYPFEELEDWCYTNVESILHWLCLKHAGYYRFMFTVEEDATAFKLRFGL